MPPNSQSRFGNLTPAEWRKIRDTADLLLDTPAGRWEEISRRELHDNEALRLAALELARSFDDSPDFLGFQPFPKIEQPEPEATLETGELIGAYRIEHEIGRGGMGRVYMASRADGAYSKTVAIKLIRIQGKTAMERFRAERRILAGLEHENIARLHDAGTTKDGSLYFVMEYVEGLPLDVYCLALGQRAVLQLFRRICAAVAFAHAAGVVHRDLKPANVLVTGAGTPKLLDFGIASLRSAPALDSFTGVTPAFASPEQLNGGTVTERSDVYSLGLLLQILLRSGTGERSRDLTAIVGKALENDPAQRYPSAAELAQDLKRHLDDQPVEAREITWAYRTRRLVKRNRVAVILTAAMLAIAIAGTAGILWQRHRVQAQLKVTGDIVHDILAEETKMQNLAGATELRRSLLQKALNHLSSVAPEDADDPDLAGELADAYLRIGRVQGMPGSPSLGDYAAAENSVRRGRTLAEEIVKRWPQVTRGRELLATGLAYEEALLGWRGDDKGCVRQGSRAQKLFEEIDARAPELSVALLINEDILVRCNAKLGQLDAAIAANRQWIAREEQKPSAPNALRLAYGRLARTLYEAGKPEESRATFRRSLELYAKAYLADGGHVLRTEFAQELLSAAAARPQPCKDPSDREGIGESLALGKEAYSLDANNATALSLLADAQRCLAMNFAGNGRVPEALSLLEENRRTLEAAGPASSSGRKRLAQSWLESAIALQNAGDWKGAQHAAELAKAALQKGQPELADGVVAAQCWLQLGIALNKQGRADEALAAWHRQLAVTEAYARAVPGRNSSLELARAYWQVGKYLLSAFHAEGVADLTQSVSIFEGANFPPADEVAAARRDLERAR